MPLAAHHAPPARGALLVIFGLFFATGVVVGAYFLWALADCTAFEP